MEKTLYLVEKKEIKIRRDGPSLWIEMDGKAGRRVPVRLIEQVIIMGSIEISTDVITLFSEENVPVTFLNRRGREIAVALPYNHKMARHSPEQNIFLSHETNTMQFLAWVRSKRRRIQLNVIRRLSEDLFIQYREKGFREEDYRSVIQRQIAVSPVKWNIVMNVIAGLFRELVMARLLKAGLDPHKGVMHRRHNFGLALDLCHILSPEGDMQCIQFFKKQKWNVFFIEKNSLHQEGIRNIIQRFENRKDALLEMTEKLIDGIFELMRDLRGRS